MVDSKTRVCVKFKNVKKGRKTVKKCMMYSNARTAKKMASKKAVPKKAAPKKTASKKPTLRKTAKKTLKVKKSAKKNTRRTLFGLVL